jgi:hypothetical protein
MNNSMNFNSFSITPESFIVFYTKIYHFDEDIVKTREIALILNIIILSMGFLDNLMCIYVFLQKKLLRHKFNWYLSIVAMFKLIFSLTLFIDHIFSKIDKDQKFLHDINETASKIIDFIVHTSDSYIAVLTVFLSLDRLVAIKNPLFIKKFITNLHTKFLISISLFMLLCLKIMSIIFCEFKAENNARILFCTVISPNFFNTLPLIVILVVNILLVIEIIKYYRNKRRSKIKDKISILARDNNNISQSAKFLKKFSASQINHTKRSHFIVIIVSDVWSILTAIPYYTLSSFFVLFQIKITNLKSIIIFQIVSSILFNTNHSIDFFIYFSFYGDFREAILKIPRKCLKK